MPTYDEMMRAAFNADKAGDTDAAQRLFDAAQAMNNPARHVNNSTDPRADDPTPISGPKEYQFGDTVRDVTKDSRATVAAIGDGIADPSKSITQNTLPENMPLAMKGRLGFMGDAALGTAATLGLAMESAVGLVAELTPGSGNDKKRFANDILGAAEVIVPELAGPSRAVNTTARGIKKASKAYTEDAAFADAAGDLDITPSLGMGGKGRAMTAAGLEKVPFSGSVIGQDAARAAGEIESAFYKITNKIGNADAPDDIGAKVQSGLDKFVEETKTRATDLYSKVGDKLPPETKVSLDNTTKSIAESKAVFAENPELAKELGLNDLDKVLGEAAENGMTWAAISMFRSSVGEAVGKISGPLSSQSDARLKRLYATLTEDMAAAAKANGATKEWDRATTYYNARAKRIETQVDKLTSAENPERAFEILVAAAKGDRATSNINRLRAIRQSMSRDDWNDVSATMIERLGKSNAGRQNAEGDAFSAVTFLTKWNELSREAKTLIVPNDVRVELEKLAIVANKAKQANLERNFSNTGTPLALVLSGGTAAVNLPLAATGLGGAFVSSKIMTNPAFLRAMNEAARGKTRKLEAMADGSGPFAKDAATILRLSAVQATTGSAANSPNGPKRATGN